MVREEEEQGVQKTRSFNLRKIFDFCHENGKEAAADDEKLRSKIEVAAAVQNMYPDADADADACKKERQNLDMELMKERFCKLLLGEDNSGGGKGVSSALALSNAITNLAASVFGEQKRLEPMDPERQARWIKEVDWLLSVTDYIVEFVPSQQKSKDGSNMEIMTTQQRSDLRMNIPALRKLDKMLLDTLDKFRGEQEFTYVSRGANECEEANDKWWLPNVKVPPGGVSEESRHFLQKQKESVNQVLKASMAINSMIISDMNVPENYIETLPRNGRESLGEAIYRNITDECFDPVEFLSTLDLSSEHKVVDLKNRIEASIVIWTRKMHHKDGKSSWASSISLERRELFEERAEIILLLLKQNFPGIPQSTLEISKIECNRDVGLSIMESYSRVLETLASTVMSRVQDVLRADSLAREPSHDGRQQSGESSPSPTLSGSPVLSSEDTCSSAAGTPSSKTLLDFIGWDSEPPENSDNDKEKMILAKPDRDTNNKMSYLDRIEMGSMRSPTARD